jgi:hypothetical protein
MLMTRIIRGGMAALVAATALSGCATPPQAESGAGQAPVFEFSECPVIASRGWNAHINAMPGPGAKPTLIITGEVDLPTPGFTVELIAGPADRMMPPGQRFSLVATPPEGMVTQVVTATPVRYSAPATYGTYRSITIGCGGKVLAEIENIQTAH